MPLDRTVQFSTRNPTKEMVEKVLTQFFSGAASVKWSEDRFIIDLPGQHSWALNQILYVKEPSTIPERWIEVYFEPSGAYVNVITRQQDEYTNGIADTLQRVLSRAWI